MTSIFVVDVFWKFSLRSSFISRISLSSLGRLPARTLGELWKVNGEAQTGRALPASTMTSRPSKLPPWRVCLPKTHFAWATEGQSRLVPVNTTRYGPDSSRMR